MRGEVLRVMSTAVAIRKDDSGANASSVDDDFTTRLHVLSDEWSSIAFLGPWTIGMEESESS